VHRAALSIVAACALFAGVHGAHAELTSARCWAKKARAWGTLRQCQAREYAKFNLGKSYDSAECQRQFDTRAEALDARATATSVPCRYRDNGDNTVTDFKTGLMWVKLSGLDGVPQSDILDADNSYDWEIAFGTISKLNGGSDGTMMFPEPGNGMYTDWRLPNIVELRSIVDPSFPGCGLYSPCIDPIFGETAPNFYWSATSDRKVAVAWTVNFANADIDLYPWRDSIGVRAVRSGL
jgi:hypothetical protein